MKHRRPIIPLVGQFKQYSGTFCRGSAILGACSPSWPQFGTRHVLCTCPKTHNIQLNITYHFWAFEKIFNPLSMESHPCRALLTLTYNCVLINFITSFIYFVLEFFLNFILYYLSSYHTWLNHNKKVNNKRVKFKIRI